ncbi:MAG TPA: hypothetical protein PLA50_08320 [Bacteroidia bacterium]|nr:hypothetical protein [Bacteroidia bacterium]
MRRKRRLGIRFGYFWNGTLHLDDGSHWHLADPARGRDVTWWQTGEHVELDGNRAHPILRNLDRDEAVPVAARVEFAELNLQLAA